MKTQSSGKKALFMVFKFYFPIPWGKTLRVVSPTSWNTYERAFFEKSQQLNRDIVILNILGESSKRRSQNVKK